MHWILKAAVQGVVARLPRSLGDRVYLQLQRKFGNLQRLRVDQRMNEAETALRLLESVGVTLQKREVLEVGTGRAPVAPIIFRLAGASRVVSVDLHKYVTPDFLEETLSQIKELIRQSRNEYAAENRATAALDQWSPPDDPFACLSALRVDYRAPFDMRGTELGAESFDFIFSNNVLEHVPPTDLRAMLQECRRLLKGGGSMVHRVDFTDHFAHGSSTLPGDNFLKFSDRIWHLLAGNRFGYTNRLRLSQYERLFESLGFQALRCEILSYRDLGFESTLSSEMIHDEISPIGHRDQSAAAAWFVLRKEAAVPSHAKASDIGR